MEEHPQARFIVETLSKAGFIAYYAGGWVRDLLLKHPSDDIDIATNAPPETIQALFPHTVPVGIAFGILIVIIEGHQYEVATFRQDLDYHDGRRPSRIEFTTAKEDAKRRDFTINGMFFDPLKQEILDYVEGQKDLQQKIIRAIGNPHERIKEDRLRMIRALRLACRFNFQIEKATEEAIKGHAKELFPAVAIERVWQELVKGHAFQTLYCLLIKLHEFSLLGEIFPEIRSLTKEEIEKRLQPIRDYPKESFVIASILPLFPNASLDDQLAVCKKLELSSLDLQFVTFLYHARQLKQDDVKWCYFYANPFSEITLSILVAHLDQSERALFKQKTTEQKNKLEPFIDRIKNKDPIVKAHDLQNAGVLPGPIMGKLLQEAEKIAIIEKIEEKHIILAKLKSLPIWPN